MAQFPLYATGLVMAAFLVAIFVAVLRIRRWKDEPAPNRENAAVRAVSRMASSDDVWMIAFLVLAVVVGLGAVLFAGGDLVSVSQGMAQTLALGGLGLLLVLFVFLGTYFSVLERGGPSARGAVIGVIVLAFLMVAVISMQLLGMI